MVVFAEGKHGGHDLEAEVVRAHVVLDEGVIHVKEEVPGESTPLITCVHRVVPFLTALGEEERMPGEAKMRLGRRRR